jgi:RNA polymerase sigma factor (sigma-70 family)
MLMRGDHIENPQGLLQTMVGSRGIDAYRRAERRSGVEEPAGLAYDLAEIEDELAAGREHELALVQAYTAEREEFTEAFDGALRALPEDERDAFILTDLRGLTSREAAGVLDTSHMTIHRRAESARLTVREEIC